MKKSYTPNSEQQEAIQHMGGPSLIIAGAGTGKTFVLTEKIKHIILNNRARPEEVLALTFTEKAAHEMEERVDRALPYGYYQTHITTFHSFADRLLREYGVHIGVSPSYQLLTGIDATVFVSRHLNSFNLEYFYSTSNPTGFVQNALSHFSRLRDENVSVQQYLSFAQKKVKKAKTAEERQEAQKTDELARIYQTYEALKLNNNYLDFSDLLFFALQLIESRPNIKKVLRAQFKYCLVDEFQDTNMVQYELIKALFPPKEKTALTVIGDDNQSIYKFRGASISNILSFTNDYKAARLFILNNNYRSYQGILDTAYSLIQHNNPDTLEKRMDISKKLIASRGTEKTASIQLLVADSEEQEAQYIAQTVQQLTKKKYQYKDCAILVRAHEHAQPILRALERSGIPFQFLGPGLLYYKSAVRDLIAFFTFLDHIHDSVSLYRVLSMPVLSIDQIALAHLSAFAKRVGRSLFEVLEIVAVGQSGGGEHLRPLRDKLPLFNKKTTEQFLCAYEFLSKFIKSRTKKSAPQLLYEFLESSGYLKELSEIKTAQQEQRLSDITRFFMRLQKIPGEFGEPSVSEVVAHIKLSLELKESPYAEDYDFEGNDAVVILTVHSSKGLEFPVVFLPALVSDRFPTRRRADPLPPPEEFIRETLPTGDYHLQEERRLFYVACTRAQDKVVLSYADYYGEKKRKKKPSLFLAEALGEEFISKAQEARVSRRQQLSLFDVVKPFQEQPTVAADTRIHRSVDYYSFSQIDVFERCPLQYKFRYMLRIPEPESAALSLGAGIHKALELFYRALMRGEEQGVDELVSYFSSHFAPLGAENRYNRKRLYKQGEAILNSYFEGFHQERGEVVAIEKSFVLKLESRTKQYPIKGVIDRIDKKGNTYEIIDYKTGKVPQKKTLQSSLQFGLYALAAIDENILGVSPENIVFTYYYLDGPEKISFTINDKQIEKVKQKLLDTLSQFDTSTFEPRKGQHCRWCPFKPICPAWDTT